MKLGRSKFVGVLILFSLFWLIHPISLAAQSQLHLTLNKQTDTSSTPSYVPDEVIVKFKVDQVDLNNYGLLSIGKEFFFHLIKNLSATEQLRLHNAMVYRINNGASVESVVANLKNDPIVEYAEPNYYRTPTAIGTNDTYKAYQWGLDNTGQTITLDDGSTVVGTANADINMPEAWAVSTGTTDVVVAVIDTGVAYNHPDLINNMWDGTNCKDDNGNALGGCIHGYDYGDTDPDPAPTVSSHGTHVAGIIAASQNNNHGIAGVAPHVKIMAIKCDLSVACLVKSIDFARVNGAQVINASYGGPNYTQIEVDAIDRFRAAGGIFVAASGNAGTNNDIVHMYPSDYGLANIISVAATDENDHLASFSDFGSTSVDVGAPGVDIYSTWAENAQLNESFEEVTARGIPTGWTVTGVGSTWGVLNAGGTLTPNNVLLTDLNDPYQPNANSTITTNTINLSSLSNASVEFYSGCYTENTDPYDDANPSDYLSLEYSSDGSTFDDTGIRWNSYIIDQLNPGQSYYKFSELQLDPKYLTSNFKLRFHWHSNSDSSQDSIGGCWLDDVKVLSYSDGTDEKYDFDSGTSMAAPHVAGLAGYLWSVYPSATTNQIMTAILNTGDTLADLMGATSTGRRINAYNAVESLNVGSTGGPDITGLTNDSVPKRSKTWTWSSANQSDTYRYSVDVVPDGVPTGAYSSTKTLTIGVTDIYNTGTFYLHVQAKDSNQNVGPVTTVYCILDNAGPIATLLNQNLNGLTLDLGETIFDVGGSALSNGQDLTSFFTASPVNGVGISTVSYGNQRIAFSYINPLPGAAIALDVGTSAHHLFDYLGNDIVALRVTFDGANWNLNNTGDRFVYAPYISGLFQSGLFVTTPDVGSTLVDSISVFDNIDMLVGDSNSDSVSLGSGTTIGEIAGQPFDPLQIQTTQVDTSAVSNFVADYQPIKVIQWGIPGVTLSVNGGRVNFRVDNSYEGQTLYVFRSPSLSSGWTATGILNSNSCTVSFGLCWIDFSQASYFALAQSASSPTVTPTPTPTGTSNNNGNNTGNSSGGGAAPPGAPSCNDRSPQFGPDLFKIVTSKGSAKIVFTPVKEQITGYAVLYGFKKGDERFGAVFNSIHNNEGEQAFTINKLNTKSTYYFKVAALNGCTSSPWSDWVPAKANRNQTVNKYKKVKLNGTYTLINQYK